MNRKHASRRGDLRRGPLRRAVAGRHLVFEPLEDRRLMALTDLASIGGMVFRDATGDGFTPGEQIAGAAIELYRDGNGNGVFDAGDGAAQRSGTTAASGQYLFDRVSAGNYFVRQPAQTVSGVSLNEQVSALIAISSAAAEGVLGTPIDSFVTQQMVVAPFPLNVPASSSQAAPEALGGERDLMGVMTAGGNIDSVTLQSGNGRLSLDPSFGAAGTYTVVWDGIDGNGAVVDHDGLRVSGQGVDLTAGGTSTHLSLTGGVDKPGGTARVRIYTDQNNWSEVQLTLVDTTGQPQRSYAIDLQNDLQIGGGAGANVANVGAVVLEIVATATAMDGQLTVIESRGPSVFSSDFANFNQADLSLSMTVDDPTPGVGQSVTFTLTVNNAGPATATGILVSDLLPVALSLTSATPTLGSYSTSSGQWDVGTLASGGSATLQLVATANSTTAVSNTAQILAVDQPDPDSTPGNNAPSEDDQASVTLTPEQADLSLTKSASNTTPNIGENVTFTITVTNAGPTAASGVSVSDALPIGLSFVGSTPTRGSYSNSTGIWTIGAIGVGESVTMQLVARIEESGNVTNTAQVATADQNDLDSTPGNNVPTEDDQASVTLIPQTADLSLAKTVDRASPNIGENVTFTLTLSNAGPNAATGVTVTDLLPDGIAYVSSAATVGGYNPVTGAWIVSQLASGANASLNLTGRIVTVGGKSNRAEVTASQQFDPDSSPGNGVVGEDDQATVTVTPQSADLSLAKAVNNARPNVGDDVTFTITLSNFGPSVATGVTVRDSLQSGLSFVSARPSNGSFDNATRIWNVGSIAAGGTATLQIAARVDSAGTTINTAEVASSDQVDVDSTPNNNSPGEDDQANASVSPQQADLSVTKTVDKATPTVGEEVLFTITVANGGPDGATGIVLRDRLPEGLDFSSATATQGSYNRNSGDWTIGSLTNGATATLRITARPTVQGVKNNAAEIIQVEQFDPDSIPANDVITEDDQASASVNPETADLSLTKALDITAPNVGDEITFTIALRNDGPNLAQGVAVRDLLPDGLEFVSSAASAGSYSASSGLWSVGSLASGADATLQLTALVTEPGAKTNVAEVSASSLFDPDSIPDNRAPGEDDRASITLAPQLADLSLTKTGDAATPNVGQTVVYTLTVSNSGPDEATGVAVRDGLPEGLAFASAEASQGSYNNATGIWIVGTLADQAEATLRISAVVEASTPKTNSAQISAVDQFDPDSTPDNNVAGEDDQAELSVTPQVADLALTKTVDKPAPTAGQNVDFTLTVTNSGPSAASGVRVRDLLPAGMSFVRATASTGSYDPGNGIWSIDRIGDGSKATLTIVATAQQAGLKVNAAEIIASEQFDPDSTPGNNDADEDDQAIVSVTPQVADLSLNKTVTSNRPDVGQNVTFTLSMANQGPSAATNVVVRDGLPEGFKFVSALPTQGIYNVSSGQWRVGTVPSGGSVSLQVIATVLTLGEKRNIIEVIASDQFDPDSTPGNNDPDEDDYAFVSITPLEIDLAVAKTVNNSAPNVGETVVFTTGVVNSGPDTATGIVLTDRLPAGLTFVSATSSQGVYDSSSGRWDLGSLAVDVGASLEIIARLDRLGTITNTVEVTAVDQFDRDSTPGNQEAGEDDQSSASVTAQVADLALTKTVNDRAPNVGDALTYLITITNAGPDAATGVSVEDQLVPGLTYLSSDPSLGLYDQSSGIWTVGVLPAGQQATLEIRALVATHGDKSNTAQVVTSDQADPDSTPANNVQDEDDQVSVRVVPQVADLTLEVEAIPDPVLSGSQLTYTLRVTNAGPSTATGVVLTDTLPAATTFASLDTTQGSGSQESGVVTVQLGDIAPGKTATVTLVVDVREGFRGQLRNVVDVSADQFDSNPADNARTVSTTAKLPPASISGVVYFDMDNDGIRDEGESAIGGVRVTLEGEDEDGQSVFLQFITEGDGRYAFEDLAPGEYTVKETQPPWFTSGKATAGDSELGQVVDPDQFFFRLGSGDHAQDFNFGEIFPYYTRRRVLASTPILYPS